MTVFCSLPVQILHVCDAQCASFSVQLFFTFEFFFVSPRFSNAFVWIGIKLQFSIFFSSLLYRLGLVHFSSHLISNHVCQWINEILRCAAHLTCPINHSILIEIVRSEIRKWRIILIESFGSWVMSHTIHFNSFRVFNSGACRDFQHSNSLNACMKVRCTSNFLPAIHYSQPKCH